MLTLAHSRAWLGLMDLDHASLLLLAASQWGLMLSLGALNVLHTSHFCLRTDAN